MSLTTSLPPTVVGAVVDPDLLKFQSQQKKSGWDPQHWHPCRPAVVNMHGYAAWPVARLNHAVPKIPHAHSR